MKFGVREIVDVVFKAADTMKVGSKTFKKYQPVFMIDTATTSSLEQATTTVYAQGGKGYARLIAWEGEKTMTFTVTDALMSPMGLKVLTGAGLINPSEKKPVHVHCTINKSLLNGVATVDLEDLIEETGLDTATSFQICTLTDVQPYATKLDGSGAGIDWYSDVVISGAAGAEFVEVNENTPATFTVKDDNGNAATGSVQLDFYLIMNNANAVTEIQIEPSSFGGYFYVEAQTLFRREDSGKDMAAEIIIPRAKVQSAFTFTMAASGDPSTFDFVMDAMPGYTRFDHTKKQMCVIQVLGTDNVGSEEEAHVHEEFPNPESPVLADDDLPNHPYFHTAVAGVSATATGLTDDMKANQAKLSVANKLGAEGEVITLAIAGGTDSLALVEPKTGWGAAKYVAVDYNTGEDTIEGISYINRGTTTVLGADDIADAEALGLAAGHMVVWVKADVAKETPATFTLEKDGKSLDVVINAKDN
jgi:hypothetical protein